MNGSDERPAREGRKRRRVIRPGTEQASIPGESKDENDEGWSDHRQEENARDAELRRNLPPHWS